MFKPSIILSTVVFILTTVTVGGAPRSVPGWPADIEPVYYGAVAVGDLLRDDGKETVICTFEGDLFIVNSSGRIVNRFSASVLPGSDTKETYAPALADIDDDGSLDIIHCTNSGLLSVYDNRGDLKPGWPVDLYGNSLSPPVIQDLTQYPGLEIIVSAKTKSGVNIYGFHADGSAVTGWPVNVPGDSANISLGDIDNDGTADILITTPTQIFAFDYRGEGVTGWPIDVESDISAPAVIADLDKDDRAEILVGTADGNAYAFGGDGGLRPGWPVKIGPRPITSPPAIANIDGVDGLEVVFVAGSAHIGDSLLAVVGDGGRMLSGFPKRLNYSVAAAPLAFDVDGDGIAEIFILTRDGSALAIDNDTTFVSGYPIDLKHGNITATPTAADIDNDGDTDVVVASEGGSLLAMDLAVPFDKAAAPWPTYQGNQWRVGKYHGQPGNRLDFSVETRSGGVIIEWWAEPSPKREYWEIMRAERTNEGLSKFINISELEQKLQGSYEFIDNKTTGSSIYYYKINEKLVDGSTNSYGPKIIKTQKTPKKTGETTELTAAFPNPFTSSTTITYRVADGDSGAIRLSVYDLSGKIVRELKKAEVDGGTYSVTWDGYDGNGNELPPGVYVCRLCPESGGEVSTRSIVLIR